MYLFDNERGLMGYQQDQDGNWEKIQSEWVNLFNADRHLAQHITQDKEGNVYVLYYEFNEETFEFTTCLGKAEEKKFQEIEVSWQGEKNFRAPYGFCILDNGDILTAKNKKPIEHYHLSDGSFVKNYEGIACGFAVADSKLYQINAEKSRIDVYDADTDKLERSIPCENIDTSTLLKAGEEGDLYLIGKFGIKHLVKDGSMWELMVDGNSTCFGMPSYTCEAAVVKDKEIYAVFSKQDGYIAIKKYTYSKEVSATPSTEIIAYSLRESNSLREIVTQYQLSHPDIKITLQVGLDKNSTLTREDAVKALNTELLAGKGPHLILLDELDIGTYIEKGLLADVSSLVKNDEEGNKYLENIVEAYKVNDKAYVIPVCFTIPTLWGDKKVIEKVKSIEDLAQYQKDHPEENILSYKTPEELINLFCTADSSYWFDNKGVLDENQMTDF